MAIVPDLKINIGPYKGSKFSHLDHLLPWVPHGKSLIEPFGGFGAVSLNHTAATKHVYECNPWVNNLLISLRDCHQQMIDLIQLRETESIQPIFNDPILEHNAIRAAVTYLLYAHASYAGGGTRWKSGLTKLDRLDDQFFQSLIEKILVIKDRLSNFNIYFESGFNSFKDPPSGAIFYIDPPYTMLERGAKDKRHKSPTPSRSQYLVDFKDNDHIQLLNAIENLENPIVLSGYDNSSYDRLLKHGFTKHHYHTHDVSGADACETLWVNQAAQAMLYRPKPTTQQLPLPL